MLEGVAFGLRDCLDLISELGIEATAGRVSGGGARSRLWLRDRRLGAGAAARARGRRGGSRVRRGAARRRRGGHLGRRRRGNRRDRHAGATIDPVSEWVEPYREALVRFRALYPALRGAAEAADRLGYAGPRAGQRRRACRNAVTNRSECSSRAPGPGATLSDPAGGSAPGGSSPSTCPPKPPPTIRAPTAPASRSRCTVASTAGVEIAKSSRRLACEASSSSPTRSRSPSRERGHGLLDALVLGDHVARARVERRRQPGAIASVASRRLVDPEQLARARALGAALVVALDLVTVAGAGVGVPLARVERHQPVLA